MNCLFMFSQQVFVAKYFTTKFTDEFTTGEVGNGYFATVIVVVITTAVRNS